MRTVLQHPDHSRAAKESHVVKNRSQTELDAELLPKLCPELFTEVQVAEVDLNLGWRVARETRSTGRPRAVMTRHIDSLLSLAGRYSPARRCRKAA